MLTWNIWIVRPQAVKTITQFKFWLFFFKYFFITKIFALLYCRYFLLNKKWFSNLNLLAQSCFVLNFQLFFILCAVSSFSWHLIEVLFMKIVLSILFRMALAFFNIFNVTKHIIQRQRKDRNIISFRLKFLVIFFEIFFLRFFFRLTF